MAIADAVTAIIQILVSGIATFGAGLASGVQSFVTALMFDSSGTTPTLSSFIGVVALFGAIALAGGVTALIFRWIMSLGGKKKA